MKHRVERHPNGKRAFPFDRMQLNDTFTVPVADSDCPRCLQQSLGTSIACYKRRHEGKFITTNMGTYIECRRVE